MEAELAQQIDLAVPSQPEDLSNEALDEDPPAPPEPAISHPPAAANSSEEENEATTLPKFTRVYVKGNQRTRSNVVGLYGRIKKTAALGGWCLIELEGPDGRETVRLQRNALTVVAWPTGDESDFSDAGDESEAQASAEALPRVRPRRPPRPMAHSPELQDIPPQKRARQVTPPVQRINFHRLDVPALKRYGRHYKLPLPTSDCSKEQLVNAVGKHFTSYVVSEREVLLKFMQVARRSAHRQSIES